MSYLYPSADLQPRRHSYAPPPPPRPTSVLYPSSQLASDIPTPPPRPTSAYFAPYSASISHPQASEAYTDPQPWQPQQQYEQPQPDLLQTSCGWRQEDDMRLVRPRPGSHAQSSGASAGSNDRGADHRMSSWTEGDYRGADHGGAAGNGQGPVSQCGPVFVPAISHQRRSPPPASSPFDARPHPQIFTSQEDFQHAEPQLPTPIGLGSTPTNHSSTASSPTSLHATSHTESPRVHTFPTIEGLTQQASSLESKLDSEQIAWAQDVFRLAEKHWQSDAQTDFARPTSPPPNSKHFSPNLQNLVDTAAPVVIAVSASEDPQAAALGLYLKGKMLAAGICPGVLPKDNRQAFKDFDSAARKGEARAWYRLGKDYEGVGDLVRAKDCFERGVKRGDCESAFRMGMAYLHGHFNLPTNPYTALPLLRQASETSTIDYPQPSYVYGLLLAGELSLSSPLPTDLIIPSSPAPTGSFFSQQSLARVSIERAAYLNYPPAQYKAGRMYEHAALGCAYDPSASVGWYTFASLNGEAEADMALSKWFLCGAEGCFPKNEGMAKTYAEKAARKGQPNGCFALGYYFETGVGGVKDLDKARKWYKKAASLGNADAPARLTALSAPVPTSISLAEHQSRLNATIVRKHTSAKIQSDRNSIARGGRRVSQMPMPSDYIGHLGMSGGIGAGAVGRAGGAGSGSGAGEEFGARWDGPPIPMPTPQTPPVSGLPNPRPVDIMSPPANYHPPPPAQPSRPSGNYNRPHSVSNPPRPMAHHQYSCTPPPNDGYHRHPSGPPAVQYPAHGGGGGRTPSGPSSVVSSSTSSTLSNLPVPVRRPGASLPPGGGAGDKKKGPQTFAEMGFVSKPVEGDGCVIM